MTRFHDKRAIITGGTTGIGLATARRLIGEGARVGIVGADADRVAAAATALDGDVATSVVDLRVTTSMGDSIDQLASDLGGVDVLVLNAGVTMLGPLGAITEPVIDDQLTLHIKAPLLAVQAALPHFVDGASIVMTTSSLNQLGMPGMAAYSASKAGQRSLVRTLAAELIGRRIRVNAIAPGPIETPIYSKLGLDSATLTQMANDIVGRIPMGRFGTPDEVAAAVAFLASDDAGYITGQELVVDGGWTSI